MGLKPLPSKKVIRVLVKIGFKPIRQSGSHLFLKYSDGRTTVVPIHGNEVIGRGLLRKIIRDAKLTREDFLRLLKF